MTTNGADETPAEMGALFVVLLAFVPLNLLNAYTIARVWNWHAVPTFGVPALTTAQGLSVVVLLWLARMRWDSKPSHIRTTEQALRGAIGQSFLALVTLGLGWIMARVQGVI